MTIVVKNVVHPPPPPHIDQTPQEAPQKRCIQVELNCNLAVP